MQYGDVLYDLYWTNQTLWSICSSRMKQNYFKSSFFFFSSPFFRWQTLISNMKLSRKVFSNSSIRTSKRPTWVLLTKSSWIMWFQFLKRLPKTHISMLTVKMSMSFTSKSNSNTKSFLFSGFVEMMSAYLPEFSQIDTTAVYNWIFQLENKMSNEKNKEEKITHVSPKK